MYKNCCIENPLVVRTASVHLPYVHVHTYTYETHEASNQENLYPSLVYAHTTQGKRKGTSTHTHTTTTMREALAKKANHWGQGARQYASPASLCFVHRQAVKDHHRDSDQESSPINNTHTHKIIFSN